MDSTSKHYDFPVLGNHEECTCFNCNRALDEGTAEINHEYEKAPWSQHCPDCNVYTWYSIFSKEIK